ncbi:MAG: (deoxy)nucleoside triphosphate pyrophosphohydrolase [Myxococcota bacterium]
MGKIQGTVRVVSAELQRAGAWLITQRSAKAVLPLLWEFPGGRVREGETDQQALARALEHRVGVRVEVHERVLEVRHDYPDYSVILAVYRCELPAGQEPSAQNVQAVAWVTPDAFGDYPFPGADQRTIEALLDVTEL